MKGYGDVMEATKTVTAEELQDARDAENAARTKVNRLADLYHEQTVIPAMRERVGKCYRYPDWDGTDAWTTYVRLTGMGAGGRWYHALHISRRPNDYTEVKIDREYGGGLPDLIHGYEEITYDEWRKAVDPILADVRACV